MSQDHLDGLEPSKFWSTRDYKTSARLHLQHWLFQNTLGFVLHPTVSKALSSERNLCVADIACGNGAWINELRATLPPEMASTATFDGFDINPISLPSQSFMPQNVRFHVRDILGEIPQELVGKFDLVHLRAFCSIIYNNDTSPLLTNVLKLLKPGGWLQWEEAQADGMIAVAPGPEVSKTTCNMVLKMIEEGGKQRGILYKWLNDISTHLERHNLGDVVVQSYPNRPEDFKAWTEDYLMVWEDITASLPSKEDAPQSPVNREMWQSLFQAVVQETNRGVVLHAQKIVVALGKKPES